MNTFIRQFRNGDILPWERPFVRELLNVGIPIVVHSLFTALLSIVDSLMIGQLGEIELAAVTQANRVTFLFQLVIFGLTSGTSTYVAQYWGKRDLKGVHAVLGLSLCVSLLAAFLFFVPSVLLPSTLMRLLLKDPLAISIASEYLGISSFSFLSFAVASCYATVQKSTEQARLPMVAGIVALLVKTALNYCLIFGNLGFPRMGVRGGAIATVVAIGIELVLIVGFGFRYKFATAASFRAIFPSSFTFAMRYLQVAAPTILNEGVWALGMVMYSVFYGQMGTVTVAAVSVFSTVEQVALSTMKGLTQSAAVLIGKRIGAGDEPGAVRTARRFLFAAIPSGLFSGLVLVLVSLPMISLFNVSKGVLDDARMMVFFCAMTIWQNQLAGLLIVGILRAGGDVLMALYLDVGPTWLIGVSLVYLTGIVLRLPIPYVFLIAQLEATAKIIVGLWRFRSGRWIHNLVR